VGCSALQIEFALERKLARAELNLARIVAVRTNGHTERTRAVLVHPGVFTEEAIVCAQNEWARDELRMKNDVRVRDETDTRRIRIDAPSPTGEFLADTRLRGQRIRAARGYCRAHRWSDCAVAFLCQC